MTAPSIVLLLMLVALALLPIGLVLQVSNWLHSRFRTRLWNLRDSLVDDLLTGRIQFSSGAIKLLDLIETHIRNAKRHSFSDVMLAVAILRGISLPSITDDMLDEDVPLSDRDALLRYFNDFRSANMGHLLSSSPSGWTAAALLGLSEEIAGRRPQVALVDPELRKQVVRVELRAMPELTPAEEATHKGPILDRAAAI
jgi:hypothetical protein